MKRYEVNSICRVPLVFLTKKVVGNRKLSLSTTTVSDAAYIESGAYNRPRLIASDAWTANRLVAAIILNVTAFSVYLGVY